MVLTWVRDERVKFVKDSSNDLMADAAVNSVHNSNNKFLNRLQQLPQLLFVARGASYKHINVLENVLKIFASPIPY